MIETGELALPHGITLSCRMAGDPAAPVLVFLHGFPEAAFVWDDMLTRLAARGYRCIAPNLRGYASSSSPADREAYRAHHLLQDIEALLAAQGAPVAALVAHDWGGAIAWGVAARRPGLMERLVIINAPHAGAFARELQGNPRQQAASAYMNYLARPDAAQRLAQDDFRRIWPFFADAQGRADWLTEDVKDRFRQVWREGGAGLVGPCSYYAASPLRPPTPGDPAAAGLTLADNALRVSVPTLVLWGEQDSALLPSLLDGLDRWVPDLRIERHPQASHWVVHEDPNWVARRIEAFLRP
ncbi:alpha/beta fold hydrolase [Ramlibacter rhizophilus]|uniref:Alpha/beta hydrolase n=1 Tax=Ramlibacter rhizophilus TaxID=1781167 RepID=A0A4Z0BLC0_9BURK|nr:alpha/beta hydrolase [Ramlibacter rhizophilus]TFY99590.1 alpha/beta hydrolase [Ramlibacter rhizophilus]